MAPHDIQLRKLHRLCANIGNPSIETSHAYLRDASRVLSGQVNIRTVASHYRYRAALRWYFQMHAAQLLNWIDTNDPGTTFLECPQFSTMVAISLNVLELLDGGTDNIQDNLGAALQSEFVPSAPATSKRDGLAELPDDWCEQMLEEVEQHPAHWIPLTILMLTGLRPRELENGVTLSYQPDGNLLRIGIAGCKVRVDRGQPLRVLDLGVDGHPEVAKLMSLLNIFTSAEMTYSFPKRSLTELVRKLADKRFHGLKITPTPISFRHQYCANLKVQGYSRSEIAQAMGHRSVTTQGKYGRRKNGRRGGCLPSQISATHEIRSDSHIVSGPGETPSRWSSDPDQSTSSSKSDLGWS